MDKDIKLHNYLAQSRYKLTLSEQKLFIYAVHCINQDADDFSTVKFKLSDFAESADLNVKALRREIKKMSLNLMKMVITHEDPKDKNSFVHYNLTQICKYDDNTGVLEFQFAQTMAPLLLRLHEHYFKQNPSVVSFKSWYAIRLYDMLKAEAFKGTPTEIELQILKATLEVEDKYPRFNNFKDKVIDPAVTEINAKSDMSVTWQKESFRNKVYAVSFTTDVHQLSIFDNPAEVLALKKKMAKVDKIYDDNDFVKIFEKKRTKKSPPSK